MLKHAASDLLDRGHAHDVHLEDTFDFVNTGVIDDSDPEDRLPTLDSALDWFVERGVIHGEGAGTVRSQAVAEESRARDLGRVHAVRAALREVANAVTEQRAPLAGSLDTINRALRARQVIELVPAPDGVNVDHRHVGSPVDDALARLADPLVAELTDGHPERIKVCDSSTCEWIFYDTSRTSRRRWCDMSTCGNRAKAARHRARERDAVSADPAGASPE